MIIIPLTGKISRKNPPIATILLVLLNLTVFFILQSGDTQRFNRALDFYFRSGLAQIEVSHYAAYLAGKEESKPKSRPPSPARWDAETLQRYHAKMQADRVFLIKLSHGEIITPADQIFASWKSLRDRYEGLLSKVLSHRYGFKPSEGHLVTALTYMFLHGGLMHLMGNMLFLWLVGCVLEVGCGRALYLFLYLITGFLAALSFYAVYPQSSSPLIGASGAISGLMGAYSVIYGKKRIRVFYSLGFYFNYARLPALVLLPAWIGNEVFQLLLAKVTHVAYVAHIGGLSSGAVLGYLGFRAIGRDHVTGQQEDKQEEIPALLEKGLERLSELDLASARSLMLDILERDPKNRIALIHLFNIDKLTPQEERFHESACRLFRHLSESKDAHEMLVGKFKEYRRLCRVPRLPPELLLRMSLLFCARGHVREAEVMMAILVRKAPDFQKIPQGILTLGRAYLRLGMEAKGRKCLQLLCRRYPGSAEMRIAFGVLNEMTDLG